MPFEPKTSFPGLLADSAARLAQDLAAEYPRSADPTLIAEMGWNAVLIPEAQGGVGGEFADLASIIEALATRAVDLPVITRCGVLPAMLGALADRAAADNRHADGARPDGLRADGLHADGARAQALLTGCAEGTVVLELGGPLCAGDPVAPMAIQGAGRNLRITGKTVEMPLSDDCTHVLLVCREVDGAPVLACVAADRLRAQAGFFHTMDEVRVCVCDVRDLALTDADIVASGADARRAIDAGWRVAVAATATDTVCAMGGVLERTITYLLERVQFGQPLAQFQALRHDVARLYVTYEISRSLLQATLREIETGDAAEAGAGSESESESESESGSGSGSSTAPSPAQRGAEAFDLLGLYTSEEAVSYAETVIQLHGGMGMTREMPAARLATRLLANAMRFGDTLSHRQSLNRLRTRTTA
ncbi:acyl-CoA dehydrogenase [Bordetella sp. LUAb4]|uniref:acyl-CoA dehydrogenase n=1 Tax=Bordetella sp. LUAb4 TaxID=2843195 RepID=UPI001E49AF51|nr:acyl-CoA dehydrogenase [Bordetella sp. LUAb4]